VPEDRLRADLDHRLRAKMGFLSDARATSTSENDSFHALSYRSSRPEMYGGG
jgi:hypothetical protein